MQVLSVCVVCFVQSEGSRSHLYPESTQGDKYSKHFSFISLSFSVIFVSSFFICFCVCDFVLMKKVFFDFFIFFFFQNVILPVFYHL